MDNNCVDLVMQLKKKYTHKKTTNKWRTEYKTKTRWVSFTTEQSIEGGRWTIFN